MRRSFAVRLAISFAALGVTTAVLTALLVNVVFTRQFTSYLDAQSDDRERQVVAALADAYEEPGGWDRSKLLAVGEIALMDGGTLRLEDPNGVAVWDTSSLPQHDHLSDVHRQMMGSGPLGPERELLVTVDGSPVGSAVVRFPLPGFLPQAVEFRRSVNRLLLTGGLLASIAALVVGIVLARRAVVPARRLTAVAGALASGSRAERLDIGRRDEFGDMAASFNRMADAVAEEDRLRRAFAADVAHELRTPITILQTQIEAMQDEVETIRPTSLSSLHDETLRLSRLVADLETMASADAAGFSLERSPVELRTVVRSSGDSFGGAFESEGVRLDIRLPRNDAIVIGDRTRLTQIVMNLLSNALKFTPAGGRVGLALETDPPWGVVRVSDTGPGIPPDEIGHVFDRFFRGRGSRAGGSGIGLSVVRELARAHGGDVRAENHAGAGTDFTVRLPLASSPQRTAFTVPSSRSSSVEPAEEGDVR